MSEQLVSVKQLNNYIKNIVERDNLLKNVSIVGEVSGFKISGEHAYFALKDADTIIQCRCFYCKRQKYLPKDGDKVILRGNVTYHIKFGLAFLVTAITAYGEGTMMLYYEELKKKLETEGLFAQEHKKQIPLFAKSICVITSRTGAVIRDIFTTTRRKNPFTDIYLIDTKVQGDTAAVDIINALTKADTLGVDTIILARGGGSFEDLLPFYDENVARTIYNLRTPIISAVGHETDFSIADFVADYRAATPTAGAEKAVFDYYAVRETLFDCLNRFANIVDTKIINKIDNYKRLNNSIGNAIVSKINIANTTLIHKVEKLSYLLDKVINDNENRCVRAFDRLDAVSPLKLVQKGMFRVTKNSDLVVDFDKIYTGDQIKLSSPLGNIFANISKIEKR